MSHIGEFDLIRRISASFNSDGSVRPGPGFTGIGDDCAILPQHEGRDTLVTTDLLVQDRHFLLSDVDPWQLGWKSAAVNISDIAAMGGRPTASFLSIALPPSGLDSAWLDRFIDGFRDMSSKFGVPLLGGDTSASPDKLFINVTVLGECPHGKALKRDTARPGDLVCVTGTLGDSAAGLKLILERAASRNLTFADSSVQMSAPEGAGGTVSCGSVMGDGGLSGEEQTLIQRHYCPMPRVAEGQALASVPGVHAMMDISDGIASDLRHILAASGPEKNEFGPPAAEKGSCGPKSSGFGPGEAGWEPLCAEIDLRRVPLSPEMRDVCARRGWDPFELAVGGGEDYELLLTVAPEAFEAAGAAVLEASGGSVCLSAIGIVLGAGSVEGGIRWSGGSRCDYQGFTHF